MPIVRRGTPDIINLYLTHPLPPTTLGILESDFALGAQDKYNPTVKLAVSDRPELYGCSPEDVRRALEAEAQAEGKEPMEVSPFLIADDQTGEEGNVVFVERWAEREDFGEGGLVEGPDWPASGPLPFVLKLRIFMHYAPVFWVNISIANLDIPEFLGRPFDPSAPLPAPTDTGHDWRNEPPYPAYVRASPKSFEVSDDPANTANRFPRPEKVYRLTDEAAEQLGLIPRWTVGWSSRDGPEGSMDFAQSWKAR